MSQNIPDLNYDSKLNIDDLKFASDAKEDLILNGRRIVFGDEILDQPRYGIRDRVNPRDITENDSDRPLLVTVSGNNPLQVNVTPGTAVVPNGMTVTNPSLIEDLSLVRTTPGDTIVVFIENEIIEAPPSRKTRYNTAQNTRRVQSEEIVRSALIQDFNNSVIFPPSRKDNLVSLSVIRVVETVAGVELQIDYTNASFSFNRPWYSPVDIEHRSFLGSGISTNRNPHGLSFNDLSSGNLTVYDQVLRYGQVQSRDDDVKGIPGFLCKENITPSRVLTDTSGSITGESRYGGPGARYIVLAAYPVEVLSFYFNSHVSRALVYDWIKGTRIIVLPPTEILDESASFHYSRVKALELPISILSNTVTLGQPDISRELVYTGSLSVSTLTNPSFDFDGSGPVPRKYRLFAKQDGTLLRTPEIILSATVLDDVGTNLNAVDFTLFGPAQLSVGLADATPVSSMEVVIRLYGKDPSNTSIQEDVTFDGDTWVDVTIPGVENQNQFIRTEQVFSSITDYQVISRTDDGPSSKIIIWAEYNTGTTIALNKLALAASVDWDGLAISKVRDLRKVSAIIPEQQHRFRSAAEMLGTGGTDRSFVLSEDAAKPRFVDVTPGFQEATNATFSIFIDDFSLIQPGDEILFGPTGKTITAVNSPTVPNRTVGEYLAATSNQATRDDMILTINDGGFNSGITATTNPSVNNEVVCTVIQDGAQGNGSVTEPVEGFPSAITLSSGGAKGGFDTHGEVVLRRHEDFINSVIPGAGTYEVKNIRDRYMSRAIPVNSRQRLTIVLHDVPPLFDQVQVRARVALGITEWEPWEVISPDGLVFSFTKSTPITKVQIEVFGKFAGLSLYEGDI